MNLHQLIDIQEVFDSKHNWSTKGKSGKELINSLSNDIVGLVGELGEFSNIVKKIALEKENPAVLEAIMIEQHPNLSEELIDTFIYLMRLSSLLNIDIEKEYLLKLEKNRIRFQKYEK